MQTLHAEEVLPQESVPVTFLIDAIVLMDQKASREAYELLIKHEADMAGWWEYDYVLGMAALDSGHTDMAIFSLQRAIAMNPSLMGARVDLGRAYFKVGEFSAAEQEFNTVLANKPNPKLDKVARQFLAAMNKGKGQKRWLLQGRVLASTGYDNNANSATENDLGNLILDDNSKKTASSYYALTGQGQVVRNFKQSRASLLAMIYSRTNPSAGFVDVSVLSAGPGYDFVRKNTIFTASGSWIKINVGGAEYSSRLGVHLGTSHKIRESTYGLFFDQQSHRYTEALMFREISRLQLGGKASFKLQKPISSTLTIQGTAGKDTPVQSESQYGRYYANGTFSLLMSPGWHIPADVSVSTTTEYSDYSGIFLSEERREAKASISSLLSWRLGRSSTVTANMNYTLNKSTIDLYDFSRASISAGYGYTFR